MLIEKIGSAAMLEQTAEECVELAQACLKYSRILRGENPASKSLGVVAENLNEEVADVLVCLDELLDSSMADDNSVMHWKHIKRMRFKERFD